MLSDECLLSNKFQVNTMRLSCVSMQIVNKNREYKIIVSGLEFDGGTMAICRRALLTGRNAL